MLYYLLLLLLASSLIECKPTGGGGGCASCGGGKGGGGKGGGGGGGGGGKGGGGGGKGGGGGGKGGGGGGKKGLYGNWVRPQTALPASEEDYRAAYGELYHQDPWAYNPYRQDGYGAERKYGQVVNKPDYSRPYYPANRPYYKVPQVGYGKGFGEDYGKSYPVTQGWYGSYDKGWQGSGGPSGYFRGTDYGTSGTEGDDRTALYVRKGLQDYQGVAEYRDTRDQPERTR